MYSNVYILNAAELPKVKNTIDMHEQNIPIFTVNFRSPSFIYID